MGTLWHLSFPWWQFLLRGAIVYLAVLLLLRLGGKRQIGQMGSGEFVAILLISNAVQNSMNGGDNSITGGLLLAATLIVLSMAIAYLIYKSKTASYILEGDPTLLIHDGKILHRALEQELLNVRELEGMLRRQGVENVKEIAEAVLESDGQLSVIKKSEMPGGSSPGPSGRGTHPSQEAH